MQTSKSVTLILLTCLFTLAPETSARGFFVSPASIFTVTNTNDSGTGSLRQAIEDANANPGTDNIVFSIGSGAKSIAPDFMLPLVTDPVVIDGTTQPGYAGRPIIELTGVKFGGGGLSITGGGTTIRGLVMNKFSRTITLIFKGNNSVENCFIGTDQTGNATAQGSGSGEGIIIIQSSGNRIGGTGAGMGNVISGNRGSGIQIANESNNNIVQGNFIGTNAAGTARIQFLPPANPNFIAEGIFLMNAANTVIGGTEPGAGNVISGNSRGGLSIQSSTGTVVQGNCIGTDVGGRYAIPNEKPGIEIVHSKNSKIGGTEPGARNIISGNKFGASGSGNGILVISHGNTASTTSDNVIQGNYIGVGEDGITAIPNSDSGIFIINALNNLVGGPEPGAGNIIAFNTNAGVKVMTDLTPPGRGNLISRNSIFSNVDLGIDIGATGVTANDAADADSGANELQNYPVLSSAHFSAGETTVVGNLNSVANTTFTIEFFVNSSCDGSGLGEGKSFLGATQVKRWGNDLSIYATFPGPSPAGQFITATATDPSGNTSEFSQCVAVSEGPPPPPTVATPLLLTLTGSEEAIALESVTFMRAPFTLNAETGISVGVRTRVILMAADVELQQGEGVAALTAQAVDPRQQVYSLPVEFVGKVPNFDSLTQVIVQLPEVIPVGDIRITITLHGKTSNAVLVRLRSS